MGQGWHGGQAPRFPLGLHAPAQGSTQRDALRGGSSTRQRTSSVALQQTLVEVVQIRSTGGGVEGGAVEGLRRGAVQESLPEGGGRLEALEFGGCWVPIPRCWGLVPPSLRSHHSRLVHVRDSHAFHVCVTLSGGDVTLRLVIAVTLSKFGLAFSYTSAHCNI